MTEGFMEQVETEILNECINRGGPTGRRSGRVKMSK